MIRLGDDAGSVDRDDAGVASSLRDVKRRRHPPFTQERVVRSAEDFLEACSAKSGARRVGCELKPPANRGPGINKPFWAADALHDIVYDYTLESLVDDDAVIAVDETDFLTQSRRHSLRRHVVIHMVRREDQLPDGRLPLAFVGSLPCLHRPRALSAQDAGWKTKRASRKRAVKEAQGDLNRTSTRRCAN
jgi:hypothetical protein